MTIRLYIQMTDIHKTSSQLTTVRKQLSLTFVCPLKTETQHTEMEFSAYAHS
ncbi:UNVERIFIED_CONTAM: hypothetical protein FKN15_047886 [Acipenser sinensis]